MQNGERQFEDGCPVRILENSAEVARGAVDGYDERTGWYRVLLSRALPPYRVNYPASRLERVE